MLSLLGISIQMMVLVILGWQLWLGFLVLAAGTIVARRRAGPPEPPARSRWTYGAGVGVASVLAVPLLMLAWGLYFSPADGRTVNERLALRGLYVLAFGQLVLCLALIWRHRGRVRVSLGAAAALWWAAGALATAGMAITNTWL